MKKLVLLLTILMLVGCGNNNSTKDTKSHRLLEKTIIEYERIDSPYLYYGYYKQVYYKYNYEYRDSTLHFSNHRFSDISDNCGMDIFINEYGDTVSITYVDFSNYPKRED